HYRLPNLDVRSTEVFTHRPGAGAYRAPGMPQVTFAVETLVDELAERLGLSPVELRRRNLVAGGDPQHDGTPWGPLDWAPVLDELARSPLLQSRDRVSGPGSQVPGARSQVPGDGATGTRPPVPSPTSLSPQSSVLGTRLEGVGIALGAMRGSV